MNADTVSQLVTVLEKTTSGDQNEFKQAQPCAVSGALQVSLLHGREHGLYLDDNSKWKMDVKGLVFKKT